LKKDTILYVDDSQLNLKLFYESYSSKYEVIVVDNSKKALEIYSKSDIDLVISDLMMPDMNGIDFLEKIMEINPFPPRILLTAYGDLNSAKNAVNRCKIFYFLQKPWDNNELELILKNAIKSYKQDIQNKELTVELREKTELLKNELSLNKEILDRLKRSDSNLRAKEQYLQNLINSAGTVIIVISQDQKILEWNLEAEKYFKLTREQVIGKIFLSVLPSEGLMAYMKKSIEDFDRKIILPNQEVELVGKDQVRYSFLWNLTPLFDNLSNSTSFIFLGQNIDTIKIAELEARASEEKYKLLAENISDVLWLMGMDGKIIYVSPSVEKLRGYTVEEIMQNDIMNSMTQDSQRVIKKAFAGFLEKTQKGVVDNQPSTFEIEQLCKDGSTIWTEIIINKLYDENNRFKYFLGVSRDITDRIKTKEQLKYSEEIFSAIFNYSPESIILTKLETGEIVNANEHFISIMGLPEKDILHKTTVEIGFWGKISERENFIKLMQENGEVTNYEFSFNTKKEKNLFGVTSARRIYLNNEIYILGIIIDITERKKHEQELRRSEEQLRRSEQLFKAITEQTTEGIALLNLSGHINLVNNSMIRMFKYSENELLGTNISQIIEEDANPPIVELISKEGFGIREIQIKDKNNEKFYVEIKGNTIKIGENKLVLMIITNINERYEAEIALRRSEARLREAQKMAHIGHYIFDFNGNEIEWSDELYRITGIKKNTPITFEDVKNIVHPDDIEEVLLATKQAIKDRARLVSEHRIIKNDGEARFVVENARFIFDDKGNPRRSIGTIQDITELKKAEKAIRKLNEELEQKIGIRTREYQESENKFRTLLKYIPDGILLINKRQQIVLLNKQIEKIFLFDSNDLLDSGVDVLFPESAKKQLADHIDDFLTKTKEQGMGDSQILLALRKNGDEFPADIRLGGVQIGDEMFTICIIRDITEKKKAEDELKKAKLDAESANKTKSEFLANMSHEIRTPLNAVLGITDILFQQLTDSTQRNYLETIKNSSKTLLTLIDDILDITKIEVGKLKLEYSYVSLKDIIFEIESIFSLRIQEKGIKLETVISKDVPTYIYIDEIRLRQILINLVSNAIKFTKEGYVKIKVAVSERRKDALDKPFIDLLIAVEDTGIGIKKSFLKNIFEVFTQQEGQDTRKYGGAGLGLAITNRLVNLMDGSLSVQSEIDKGSTFFISLKKVKFSEKESDLKWSSDEIIDKKIFLPCKIIIADDNKNNRKFLKGGFANSRIEVFEASNATEVLELIEKINPDALVTDILMPGMDGFQLSQKIKNNPKFSHIPIIANSAAVMSFNHDMLEKAAFDDFISKPIDFNKLLILLKKYLPHDVFGNKNSVVQTKDEPALISPELIDELEKMTLSKWKMISNQQKMENVTSFIETVEQFGKENSIKSLIAYSQNLNDSLRSFSIDKMIQLINFYPKLIDSFKSGNKNCQ
jgi:PAS domain S-box-containing protein